jgi:fatty acid desaturase
MILYGDGWPSLAGGLADNVVDYRLNTRTVYMNPITRFIYWDMNYDTDHHMCPLVRFHAMPRLHELVKNDLPPRTLRSGTPMAK